VAKLLFQITNKKYYAIAVTLYSSGVRLSECLNLQIKDIDSHKMFITVRNGKGKKDRITISSQLRSLFLANKKLCYSLLFQAVKRTIIAGVLHNERRFHGHAGFIAMLHTWDQPSPWFRVDVWMKQKLHG